MSLIYNPSAASDPSILKGDVTGPLNKTVISTRSLMNKPLTGLTSMTGPVTANDTLVEALSKLATNSGGGSDFKGEFDPATQYDQGDLVTRNQGLDITTKAESLYTNDITPSIGPGGTRYFYGTKIQFLEAGVVTHLRMYIPAGQSWGSWAYGYSMVLRKQGGGIGSGNIDIPKNVTGWYGQVLAEPIPVATNEVVMVVLNTGTGGGPLQTDGAAYPYTTAGFSNKNPLTTGILPLSSHAQPYAALGDLFDAPNMGSTNYLTDVVFVRSIPPIPGPITSLYQAETTPTLGISPATDPSWNRVLTAFADDGTTFAAVQAAASAPHLPLTSLSLPQTLSVTGLSTLSGGVSSSNVNAQTLTTTGLTVTGLSTLSGGVSTSNATLTGPLTGTSAFMTGDITANMAILSLLKLEGAVGGVMFPPRGVGAVNSTLNAYEEYEHVTAFNHASNTNAVTPTIRLTRIGRQVTIFLTAPAGWSLNTTSLIGRLVSNLPLPERLRPSTLVVTPSRVSITVNSTLSWSWGHFMITPDGLITISDTAANLTFPTSATVGFHTVSTNWVV